MPTVLPVVAAIPNYNMAEYLLRLLPQVLAQGYQRVFVLDDASTDHTVDALREFGDAVTLVRSPRNQGAGRNRNQIIDHVDDETLIHFIDADMDLLTTDTASVIADLYARYAPVGVGVIGGLVRRADGTQEPYNTVARSSPSPPISPGVSRPPSTDCGAGPGWPAGWRAWAGRP